MTATTTQDRCCGCDHPHVPGSTFCYLCDLPLAPAQDSGAVDGGEASDG